MCARAAAGRLEAAARITDRAALPGQRRDQRGAGPLALAAGRLALALAARWQRCTVVRGRQVLALGEPGPGHCPLGRQLDDRGVRLLHRYRHAFTRAWDADRQRHHPGRRVRRAVPLPAFARTRRGRHRQRPAAPRPRALALAQRLDQPVHRREALRRRLGQRAEHRALEIARGVGATLARGLRHRLQVMGQDLGGAVAVEGHRAGQHLVGHHAERIDVGATIHGATRGLLGRHVARVAEGHAQAGGRGVALGLDQLGQAEIEQLDEARPTPARGQEDVARAQIAMHVAHRVRLHQRLAELGQHVHDGPDGLRPGARQQVGQRLAVEQLHDQEQPAIRRAPEVVHLHDVIIVDLAHRGGLAAEALDR